MNSTIRGGFDEISATSSGNPRYLRESPVSRGNIFTMSRAVHILI